MTEKFVDRRGELYKCLLFFFKGVAANHWKPLPGSNAWENFAQFTKDTYSEEGAVVRFLQTPGVLLEHPILNICQLEATPDVPYRTAQRYIERLKEIGILREVTGQARNSLYGRMKSSRL